MTAQTLRFDDVEALRARIGEDFSPWGPQLEVSQDMIDRFAELTGDRQWIHTDVERARRESPYKTTIAHGFLLLSLLPVLRQRVDLQITGHAQAIHYGADRVRFMAPVPAGSRVHARARITAVETRPTGTLVTEEIQLAVVGQDKPALSYTMLVLYQAPSPVRTQA
ncbi:MAG: MaoC family dehydratase [Myxococcales bacterium]|nr:MaoC family dehydratase [Myxococcota bacterium]MDW8280237.1 MaoC family dehydratase [Myxococcales bacterium]